MPNRLRLASYNIRKCLGLDRRRDPGRILEVVNGVDADIVALQEADLRLGPRPAALPVDMILDETDFVPVDLATSGVSLGWHGNAFLVRKGLSVSNPRRIDLPGLEPRGAIAMDVEGLSVVGVHLGLVRMSRRAQLAAIRLVEQRDATVIMGDFNEWSMTRGMEELEGPFTVHAPGRSFHAARPVASLDRFALGRAVELRDAGVVETPLSRMASDHLPVWADVSV